jgi:hypothetical protein
MKKIFHFLLLPLIIISFNTQLIFAADWEAKADAEVLKVTMRKVELCTGFQGGDFDDVLTDAFCNDPIVVGSGDQEVDIASVSAGLAAAAYGQPTLLPLGETFTHLRVTVDRKFRIKAKTTINTGSPSNDTKFCATKTTTDAMYGGGTGQAGKKYTHRVAIDSGTDANATREEMDLYWVNGRGSLDQDEEGNSTYNDGSGLGSLGRTFSHCYGNSCGASHDNWNWTYGETAASNAGVPYTTIANSIPRFSTSTDDVVYVYELAEPYTVTMKPPSIDIAFSTKDGIMAYEASDSRGSRTAINNEGKCAFTIGNVFVKVTIKDKVSRRARGSWR